MESYALLIAATLNAGTVLAIASLGLLINEKAGIVNLGARGHDAVRRHCRLCHRGAHGQRHHGFPGRHGRWRADGGHFGMLVIWLNTNQYATGLALSLFGAGFSAFAAFAYVQEKMPERPALRFLSCPTSAGGARRCFASIRWST